MAEFLRTPSSEPQIPEAAANNRNGIKKAQENLEIAGQGVAGLQPILPGETKLQAWAKIHDAVGRIKEQDLAGL